MRGLRRGLAALVALIVLAPVTPSSALPPGPPTLWLQSTRTGDTSVMLVAQAADPDGAIIAMSLCVESGPCEAWAENEPGLDVEGCLRGDRETISFEHTFPGPGIYSVTVSATGAGCPVLGGTETVQETYTIAIPEPPAPHDPIACADQEALTASAPGVTETTVTLAATVIQSGPLAASHADIPIAMVAAARAINEVGGICGRELMLQFRDDGGDEERRRRFIEGFSTSGDIFALVGQDVTGSIDVIEDGSMPVVGSFAETRAEFDSPWIWPIRAGNDSFGWITVAHAYQQGARRFGLVYDSTMPLGVESKEALEEALSHHDDASLIATAALHPAQASYSREIADFNTSCGGTCDVVVYATREPTTLTWMAGRPQRGTLFDVGHPVLFSESFAANCGAGCNGMLLFTDFHPRIGTRPDAVDRYCHDLRGSSPTAECTNPYPAAAYAAVFAAARAMGAAGTELTRDGLQDALGSIVVDTGLTGGPLSWNHPRRHANHWLRGYSIVIAQASFAGFRSETGWLEDPRG